MNNLSTDPESSADLITNTRATLYFGKRPLSPAAFFSVLGILAITFIILASYLGADYQTTRYQLAEIQENSLPEKPPVFNKTGPTAKLIQRLRQYGLWSLSPFKKVPRFFIKTYPEDLNTVEDISLRKKIFLHSLLPHALLVRQEVMRKRKRFKSILSKIDCELERLDFDRSFDYGNQCYWSENLPDEDVEFVQRLSRDYRTTSAETLLERVDAVPVSIILAQGALESFWGSSRFSREGNSIFGMWTWKTAGIVPARRDEGKTHKVKIYDSILASVRAYQLTLNRLEPYEQFRQLRRLTDDPLVLANGLELYSERGQDYVEDIKQLILFNNLQMYDTLVLNELPLPEFAENFPDSSDHAVPDKASL